MSKRFLLILAAITAIFIGIVVVSNDSSPSNQSTSEGSNHTQGEGTKGVTLVEFGDFQCPACASYFPILQQLKKKYGDDITFRFRHFPLVQIHQNAMVAHRASEAAAMQDKFWEMHDLLYQRQQLWKDSNNPTALMESYASELKLDIEKYQQDFSSKQVADIISADIKAAQAAGATSTPTFVLNGQKIEEIPRDVEGFSKLIDQAAQR